MSPYPCILLNSICLRNKSSIIFPSVSAPLIFPSDQLSSPYKPVAYPSILPPAKGMILDNKATGIYPVVVTCLLDGSTAWSAIGSQVKVTKSALSSFTITWKNNIKLKTNSNYKISYIVIGR